MTKQPMIKMYRTINELTTGVFKGRKYEAYIKTSTPPVQGELRQDPVGGSPYKVVFVQLVKPVYEKGDILKRETRYYLNKQEAIDTVLHRRLPDLVKSEVTTPDWGLFPPDVTIFDHTNSTLCICVADNDNDKSEIIDVFWTY